MQTGRWSVQASQCFTRISDTYSWIDHCYGLYRLANDTDQGRDWYVLHHFASMKSNPPWAMNAASIGSAPAGGTLQTWVDWQPRSDTRTTGCQQVILAIAGPAPGISDAVTQCDQWRVAKATTGGTFSVTWDRQGTHELRELSMLVSVSVPEGAWPIWYVPASVSGSPF